MEILCREGWFRVWSKTRCSRIKRERREKKRRRYCSSAYLQPTQAKNRKREDPNYSMAVEIDRAEGE